MGTVNLLPGKGSKAMMPTAHPPLKPRFRMNAPVSPHLHGMQRHNYAFILTDSIISRTHPVLALQPQTVYVSWPISDVHNLLYSAEDITII
jgi:hypothetical protein